MSGIWHPIGDGEWVGSRASERFPVYTRGNAGEVYPEVFRPLSFSIANQAGEAALRRAALSSGLVRPAELADVDPMTAVFSGVFGGYAYLNLSVQRVATSRMPGGSADDVDATYLGLDATAPPHVPDRRDRSAIASLAGLAYGLRLIRTTALPQLDIDRRRVDGFLDGLADVSTASDDELRTASSDRLIDLFMDLFETHLKVSGAAGGLMSLLTQWCEKHLDDGSMAIRLVSGLGGVDSAAPSIGLWHLGRKVADSTALTAMFDDGVDGLADRLAAAAANPDVAGFDDDFRSFLDEFGSRGPNEWDTAFDTWETDRTLALTLVDRMRGADASHDPTAQRERLAIERNELERDVLAGLGRVGRFRFSKLLAATRLFAQGRERTKTTVVRAIHGTRLAAQELDRRLVERSGGERGDLWFMVADELDAYVRDPVSFADTIAERRRMHAELARRIPPFFFEGSIPPLEEWELRGAQVTQVVAGEVLTGLPGCAGIARGRARVVTDPADPRGLEPGDVLIAPLTDPSWTPLFVPADAVIVDVGAVMSHAVIVSRELGIPCAVSVVDATRRIPDGTLVEVDGGAGTVTVIELPS